MNFSNYRVSLDMHDTSSQAMLNVKQGDSARRIYFSLTDGGRPYKISAECTAVLRAKTSADTILFNDCTIKDNIIEYTLTNETCNNVGIVECEVTLYGADSNKITSPRFSLIVEGVITSDNEIESTNEFTALDNALKGANNLDVSVSKVNDTATIFVTKKDGTTETATIKDGVDGKDAKDIDITLLSNVLKGHSRGGYLTDISPIEHNIVCRVKSKNKIPNQVLNLANWTNTKFNTYYFYSIELEAGKTYCLSGYSSSTTGKYDYLYLMKSNDNFSTTSNVIQLFRDSTHNNGKPFVAEEGYKYAFYYYGAPERFSQYYNLMIEEGASITQYAPMLEDLTQAGIAYTNDGLDINERFVYADENGDIEGIVSHYPLMTFRLVYTTIDVSTESAVLEIIYNRDINKAFEELKNAIISLGGNV